jgi:hypothetical protein
LIVSNVIEYRQARGAMSAEPIVCPRLKEAGSS